MSGATLGVLVDESGRRRRMFRRVGRAVSVLLLLWLALLALGALGIEPLGNLPVLGLTPGNTAPPKLPARVQAAVAHGGTVAPRSLAPATAAAIAARQRAANARRTAAAVRHRSATAHHHHSASVGTGTHGHHGARLPTTAAPGHSILSNGNHGRPALANPKHSSTTTTSQGKSVLSPGHTTTRATNGNYGQGHRKTTTTPAG
jgi:hypothetical protein